MKYLNKTSLIAVLLSGSLIIVSCGTIKNANNTQKGAAIGTTGGALLGGILGNNIGHGGHGAIGSVLGGVVGGVAGGLIGNKMDKQAKEISQTLPGAQVERVGEGLKVILNESTINFDFNSANLTATAKDNLDKLITVFKNNPDTNINVSGYTDNKGSDSYNVNLSEKRANSVINYFVANELDKGRFIAKGMGKSDPIATNDTEQGRAQNRRVEFTITANQKMVQDAQQGK
ncbi:OmpA family protein [Elizabethkingia anophelis]|uniref:OmpA family protein n=1 Tax=Elizabethkingia anophelis TaxID=1117645 RepID=UPI00137170B7|nr:OmpA family protein [Elizabethkingia anophelis]MYY27365.1 OmpA family protein [Elizabethkingia anophelis]